MTSSAVDHPRRPLGSATVGSTSRQVPLLATSPAQRATHRARPVVLLLAVLVAVVALALLILPPGPVLSGTMEAALLFLAGLLVALRSISGSKTSLQGTSLAWRIIVLVEIFVIGGSAIHYFTSLLLAPLLDAPVKPPGTLLWAVLAGIPVAVFLVWATSPIKPRPPQRP